MKLGSAKAWARTLGAGMANIQHGVDTLAEWGFKQLKTAGEPPKKDRTKNRYLRSAKRITKGTIGFLGQLGDNYYKKYEELKRRHP